MTGAIRCANCGSENIEPRGNQFYCSDCGKLLPVAAGEEPPQEPAPGTDE